MVFTRSPNLFGQWRIIHADSRLSPPLGRMHPPRASAKPGEANLTNGPNGPCTSVYYRLSGSGSISIKTVSPRRVFSCLWQRPLSAVRWMERRTCSASGPLSAMMHPQVLQADPNIDCYTSYHVGLMAIAAVGLLLYTAGSESRAAPLRSARWLVPSVCDYYPCAQLSDRLGRSALPYQQEAAARQAIADRAVW
jgi:hypothetical protein